MKSVFLLLLTVVAIQLSAQSDYDSRLLAKFSEAQISDYQKDHQAILEYWSFYLDHAYEIVDLPSEKNLQPAGSVKIKDLDDFNILALNLSMDRMNSKFYGIEGSDKKLMLLSNDRFSKKFNAYRENQ